VPEVQN